MIGNRSDAGVRAERHHERGIGAELFGDDRHRDFVEGGAAIFFGNSRAEKTHFARLADQLRHETFFVLFELGNVRDHFLCEEFLERAAEEALIVGEVGGREDVFGAGGCDEKRAAAIQGLRNRCRRHTIPSLSPSLAPTDSRAPNRQTQRPATGAMTRRSSYRRRTDAIIRFSPQGLGPFSNQAVPAEDC